LPILSAWLVLATPDSPLFLTDALALYASVRALETPPRSRSALGWWLASGAALALGLASKLLAILLPFGLVLALLSRRELRGRLAEPGLYAGALLAALMVGPVSAVSASIATRFQLHHGLGRSNGSALWQGLDFVTGQAGMAGGILFVLLAIAVVRSLGRSADAPRYALAVVALSTFAVFAISSLRHRVEANWPLPAYLPALVLLATMDAGERWRRWVRAGIGVGGGIVAVGYLQMLTPVLPFGEELVRRGHGWDEVAERVTERRASHTWVAGNTYQDAAELAFQLADHPRVFALNLRSRDNQYSAWPGFPDLARVGDDLIFVLADRHDLPPAVADLQRHFVRVRLVDSIGPTPHLLEVPARRIWLMEDWRGSWPERD
jgi:undecaprenyl-diphosphatase